jgi:sialic acid synthase
MRPPKPADDLGNEYVFKKLGKSLVAYTDIKAGEKVTLDSLSGVIFREQYIPVRESNLIVGRIAIKDIAKGELIQYADLQS